MFDSSSQTQASSNKPWASLSPVICVAFVSALVVARLIGTVVLPTYDDAFITYRYARNLATGVGFVYHPNEWVLGATCPAFGVLVSLFYRLGLDVPSFVAMMNIVCDAVIVLLVGGALASRVRDKVNGENIYAAILFALFFTLSPTLTRICVGGMESNLFLLCSLGAILLYHQGVKIPAIAIAAGSYFLRPEGALLVVILCGLELLTTRRLSALRLPVVAIVVLAPFLFLIQHYYGHILPQSVLAKSHAVKNPFVSTFKALVLPESDPLSYLILPLALWGIILFFREKGWRENSFLRTIGIWYVLYLVAYLWARPHIWSWYSEPVQFGQILFASLGTANLLARVTGLQKTFSRPGEPPNWIAMATSVLAIVFWALILSKRGPSGATRYVYQPIQAWSQTPGVKNSRILAEDIGAVGYYTNAYIYDAAGLVWPPAVKYLGNKSNAELIRDYKPDYLFINAEQDTIEMMQQSHLDKVYEPIQRFSVDNDTEIKQEVGLYNAAWKQDYLLYKKRSKPLK